MKDYSEKIRDDIDNFIENLSVEITPEMVKDWEDELVTQLFFGYIQLSKLDSEAEVYKSLSAGKMEDAAAYCAAREQIDEIIKKPAAMKSDLKDLHENRR